MPGPRSPVASVRTSGRRSGSSPSLTLARRDDGSVADGARIWLLEELREHHAAQGRPYDEVLRVDALSAGLYRVGAGAIDPQAPHGEDEVYVVLAGIASIEIESDRAQVSPGTVVYVPQGMRHRFVDVTEDLEVLVVFAPPESR